MKHRWLNYILKDGFAHVRLVIHQPHVDILVDPNDAVIGVYCYNSGDILNEYDGATRLRITRLIDIKRKRRMFGFLNCVEIVKGSLGLRAPFVFTPYQLYKELKNDQSIQKAKGSILSAER